MRSGGAASVFFAALLTIACAGNALAGTLPHKPLQRDLARLARGFDGRVGACVLDEKGASCVNGGHSFSMQSVMKLLVALAVMDGVDRQTLRLDDKPSSNAADKDETTTGDLLRRAIIKSDNKAVDSLIAQLGGPRKVQAVLRRKKIRGIRLDRDEGHLQANIAGLSWDKAYGDEATFTKAQADVPTLQRTAAYRYYQADIRDTATPHAMALFLRQLAEGKLLSPESTKALLDVMAQTETGTDRLKAGLPADWTLMHKTGTSGSWQGVTAATNDVGILKAPDGGLIEIAVFVGDSRASPEARAGMIAKIAATVVARYQAAH